MCLSLRSTVFFGFLYISQYATFPETKLPSHSLWRYHRCSLGDRHCENILLDTTTGDVVHVDFNMLFWKGTTLAVKEVVPFRLTPHLVDALGPSGVDGIFREVCEITMRLLRTHRDTMLCVLQPFIYDPVMRDFPVFENVSGEVCNVLVVVVWLCD
jgi:Phosphatidylinositol 3- and 4-kinase